MTTSELLEMSQKTAESRALALDEAAQVVEGYGKGFGDSVTGTMMARIFAEVAQKIREL